jgi:hypothetical protein
MELIKIDFKNIREERQVNNYDMVYNYLKSTNDIKDFCGNKEALKRLLKYSDLTYKNLLKKCKDDDLYCKAVAFSTSKQSSRQGSKDEVYTLDICNIVANKVSLEIKNIPNTSLIPTKCGKLISKKVCNKLKINKSECLKSIDGILTEKNGKCLGYIFAKITYSSGGHQDNVFEESNVFAEWSVNFGDKDKYYILLIDTDLTKNINQLKEKYKKYSNIWIVNHYELQERILNLFIK